MRELKFHEKKLLKKVDFLKWKREDNLREIQVMRRYHIQDRDDYKRYSKIVGRIAKLANVLKKLEGGDATRIDITDQLLTKLYDLGAVSVKKSLVQAEALPVSALARRRLAIVMVRLRMAETVKEAVTFIEQGHVRVGPNTVTDPAHHVTRTMEDFVTWVDTSRIKRKVMAYNDQLDDYDLLT